MASSPVCQREGDTHGDATRRVTVHTEQPVTELTTIDGMSFLSQDVTLDLCTTCYEVVAHDPALTITTAVTVW